MTCVQCSARWMHAPQTMYGTWQVPGCFETPCRGDTEMWQHREPESPSRKGLLLLWDIKVHYSIHKEFISWVRLIQSFLSHATTLRSTLILSSYVCLILSRHPLTSGFQRNILRALLNQVVRATLSVQSAPLQWSTNSKALHYEIFSTLLFFPHRFSSGLCSQPQFVFFPLSLTPEQSDKQTAFFIFVSSKRENRRAHTEWQHMNSRNWISS